MYWGEKWSNSCLNCYIVTCYNFKADNFRKYCQLVLYTDNMVLSGSAVFRALCKLQVKIHGDCGKLNGDKICKGEAAKWERV